MPEFAYILTGLAITFKGCFHKMYSFMYSLCIVFTKLYITSKLIPQMVSMYLMYSMYSFILKRY